MGNLRIGLALSGGGFRATMFHLGVVRLLLDAGLLPNVRFICSVSGGSILAAHMAQNWASYSSNAGTFKNAAKTLIEFVEQGIRENIVLRLPFYWCLSWLPRMRRLNATSLLWARYRDLYKTDGVASLAPGGPEFHVLATNLTRPSEAFCFSQQGCEHHHVKNIRGKTRFGPGAFEVAGAVTASSAFPGVFPPLIVTANDLGTTQEAMGAAAFSLSDGGVFDNLGVRALRDIDSNENLDVLIVSDAGASLDVSYGVDFLRGWSYLPRLIDIMGARIGEMESRAASAREVLISIHKQAKLKGLDPGIQQQLGVVRTDLDSFTTLLIRSLICHGYANARQAVAQHLSRALRSPSNPRGSVQAGRLSDALRRFRNCKGWEPYDSIPGSGMLTTDVKRIQGDRTRSIHLSTIVKDWVLWVWVLLVCGGGVGLYLGGDYLLVQYAGRHATWKRFDVSELSAVIEHYWNANKLSAFAKDYIGHRVAVSGKVFARAGNQVNLKYETTGVNGREIWFVFDSAKSVDLSVLENVSVKAEGDVKSVSDPHGQGGVVRIVFENARITPE